MIEGLVLFAILVVTIVVVLGGLSLVLHATSKPSDEELRVLTSSHAGESVVAYRVCNALIGDAVADLKGAAPNGLGPAISHALNWTARRAGGLWVGGRVFLTTHRIVFVPNAMNRAVHRNLETVVVDLKDVTEVSERFGLVTRVVEIKTRASTFAIRAYDVRAFADQVRARLGR